MKKLDADSFIATAVALLAVVVVVGVAFGWLHPTPVVCLVAAAGPLAARP